MENENTNDSEFSSDVDVEFPNYIPLKAKVCVVCASILQAEFSGNREQSSQVPVYSDRFLEGLSVFCETLSIDKCYTDCENWAVDGGDENFVRYVCCRACYSRFAQLVTLHELIVATQVSLRNDVRAIQSCIIESQAQDVDFSHNTCHRFRQDVIQNFETVTHDVAAPEFLLTSDVEEEVGNNTASDIESDGDYYADSTFFENDARNQEPVSKKRVGRPRKPKASIASILSIIDEVVGQHDHGFPVPPVDTVEVSSTVEEELNLSTSPIPPLIVSPLSSADQGQDRVPLTSAQTSDSETSQVKRNRGRPRKNNLLNSSATLGNHSPASGCLSSLDNTNMLKKKRGRPRKSAPIDRRSQSTPVENLTPVPGFSSSLDNTNMLKKNRGRPRKSEPIGPRSQTTPVENLTSFQVSSCLPDNDRRNSKRRLEQSPLNGSFDFLSNATHEISYEEGPLLSTTYERIGELEGECPLEERLLMHNSLKTVAIKRGRGRPRKYKSLGSTQTKPEENLFAYLRLKANGSSSSRRPPLNESIDSLSNMAHEFRHEESSAFSPNNICIIKRKRGRPRKEKESPGVDSDLPRTVVAKRGRGRPRKDETARLNSGRENLKR